MASVEITNSGYMVRFLKVTASANISKIAGALTFYTTNNLTYLYLGTDGTSAATGIASVYADKAGLTAQSLTFLNTPNSNTSTNSQTFNGGAARYISYTTIGAMSDKFRVTALGYSNGATAGTGGTLTITLNDVDTTNGTPTTSYNAVSKANTITCTFPATVSMNISGTAANATNAANATLAGKVANALVATTGDSAPSGYTLLNGTTTTYDGSGKRAINYAAVGAAKANTAITDISWTTGGDTSATNGVISGTKSAVITLTRAAGNLTTDIPISLPINITGKSASVDKSITFTNYADAKSAGTSYNGNAVVNIDISRNVVIAPFTISQGHTTITLTNNDIHADSSIANIIITSGANAMTTAFSFENTTTSNATAGTIVLTFGAPTAAVTGYAIIVRGTTMASTASTS